MPIRQYARLTVRPVLSVLAAWSCLFGAEMSADDRPPQEPAPLSAQATPEAHDDAEGVTRIGRHGEPEGIAWLKKAPSLSSLVSWLWTGPPVAGERPAAEDVADNLPRDPEAVLRTNKARWGRIPGSPPEGPVTPDLAQLRDRMVRRLQGTSVPVMVAPLDSCTPVDVGQIEDLLFADPATADRIIRAAGQGFRVVVLTPVADPNPSPDSQDCPRPAGFGASGPIAADGAFPEPTPIHQDPEGRVQMRAVPRPVARNQWNPASPIRRQDPSPGRNADNHASGQPEIVVTTFGGKQSGIVFTERRNNPPPSRTSKTTPDLLVPPAPEFDAGTAFPIALSPEPPRVLAELSPADHLRIAATKLARQGLNDEAEQLRTRARDLDSQIDKRLAELRSQQEQLAAEVARLTALRDTQRQIRMSAQIIEVNRKRMTSPEGVALVRRHLQDKFDENAQFWSQVTSAAVVPEFIREAGQKGFLNVLSRPHIITTPGREATIEIGSQLVVPIPGGKPQTRTVGIHFTLTPHLDEGGQLRLDAAPEVSRVDHSNAVRFAAGHIIPGIHVQRRSTEVKLSFGQTVAMGGFHSPTPHLDTRDIQQAAVEAVDPHARNYEILFLVTPLVPAEAASENPAGH